MTVVLRIGNNDFRRGVSFVNVLELLIL